MKVRVVMIEMNVMSSYDQIDRHIHLIFPQRNQCFI